jgi:hypothetical protein
MRRKFLLPALAACAMLAIGAPVSSARTAHATKTSATSFLLTAVKHLQSRAGTLEDLATGFKSAISSLNSTVEAIVAGVPAITSALTKINNALNNTSTGLVGLNLARPQFGTFKGSDGSILGGTGQVSGASGPKSNATRAAAGTYVVDFGNDVSKRSLVVAIAPGATAAVGEAADCANVTGGCLGSDTSANHVLVLTYVMASSNTTPADATFTVTAISG